MVRVISGANEQPGNVGATVGDTRESLRDLLNLEDEVEAVVNGEEVDDDYILQDEDVLEFIKESGDKG